MSENSTRLRKDSSTTPGKAQDLKKKILEEIKGATKNLDKPELAYVCHYDLTNIWKDSRIKAVIEPISPSPAELMLIQRRMIIILSTLVWIGAYDCLSKFTQRLFESGSPRFTDDDVPLKKSQLSFLESEPAHQEQFYDQQFRFKPAHIILESTEVTQKLHPKERLPFETRMEHVAIGGYGEVECVGISPRYIKQLESPAWESTSIRHVACKRVRIHKDFKQEKENLLILKESLTSHKRIMLHLKTIEHGPNRYILLPYASYGDLEVFLHCGKKPHGEQLYDFDRHFAALKNINATIPLLNECFDLAHALEWLHKEIIPEGTSTTVFCAHMDLKPANILISTGGDDRVVGKWMITDFGISVFREDTQEPDPEIVSIGDYYSQVTMNTRPRRQAGAYQAPEVAIAERIFGQRTRLTPEQKGVGRRSDIWSFGCILGEVLAFSLGKDTLVRQFQDARLAGHRDDYFYTEKRDRTGWYLEATDTEAPKLYEVRDSALSWLQALCHQTANSQNWVDCYVGTIKEVLVVDTEKRPDATLLMTKLQHLRDHIKASPGSPSSICSSGCPILNPKPAVVDSQTMAAQLNLNNDKPSRALPNPPPPLGTSSGPHHPKTTPSSTFYEAQWNTMPPNQILRKPVSNQSPRLGHSCDVPIPGILRTNTKEFEIIQMGNGNNDSERNRTHDQGFSGLESISEQPTPLPDDGNHVFRPSQRPIPVSEPANADGTDSRRDSSNHSLFAKPHQAHGLMENTILPMCPELSRLMLHLPKSPTGSVKIDSLAMSSWIGGMRVACLAKSSVFLYSLDAKSFSITLEKEIALQSLTGWTGISLAGNYLAVWGFSGHKLLHFCDVREPNPPKKFSKEKISMLQRAAVSERGVLAWICRRRIYFTTIDPEHDPILLSERADQNYTDLSFNDTGERLFAWAYGQNDSLYVWACHERLVNPGTESESHYETEKKVKPDDTRLLPYNTHLGCIVLRPNKRLFPAQVNHSSLRGQKETGLCLNEIELRSYEAGCMFNDHSLITVEKRRLHRHLREYRIDYKATHLLVPPKYPPVCSVESSITNVSQMRVVKQDNNIVVIICNKDGTVEFLKASPQQ